jgi:hypothetical protein
MSGIIWRFLQSVIEASIIGFTRLKKGTYINLNSFAAVRGAREGQHEIP